MNSLVCKTNNSITPKQVLVINNKLRSLGFKTSHIGYRYLIKAIQIKYLEYDELDFSNFNLIYEKVSAYFNNIKTPTQIEDCIYYNINHRNNELTKRTFESVFGYEYNQDIFSNKEFIEEFVNMLIVNEI